MSKKKVEIKRDALEPQTIKVIKNHNFGFLFVLFTVIVFGAVIYFLPNLRIMYDNYIRTGQISFTENNTPIINNTVINNTNENINTNTNTINNTVVEPVDNTTYLVLNTDNKVSFSNVVFDNISYNNGQINVVINSNQADILYMSKLSYFMNIYNANKEKIKTVYFYENVNESLNKTITIENAYYYNIVSMSSNDYNYFVLEPNELDQTFLTCSKNNNTIKYTFSDEVLSLIEDTTTIYNADDTTKEQYNNMKLNYESNGGITVQVINDNPYYFIVNVDLKLYNGNLKPYYFSRSADAREIKYKLEAIDFTCR